MKIVELKISQIMLDGGTNARAKVNFRTIADYSRLMKQGIELPPVTVFFDGSKYWLADGFRRIRAAIDAGFPTIQAQINEGSRKDALFYGLQVLAKQDDDRTNADKRRAVSMFLSDSEWSTKSNQEIAKTLQVSISYVGSLRRDKTSTATNFQEVNHSVSVDRLEIETTQVHQEVLFEHIETRHEPFDEDDKNKDWHEEQKSLTSTERCIIIDPYLAQPDVIAKIIKKLKLYYKKKTGKDYE